MFDFVSLLKYKRHMTSNQIMCKPAPLRCAGLHNLLPVIRRLYFNKLTKGMRGVNATYGIKYKTSEIYNCMIAKHRNIKIARYSGVII